MVDVRDFELFLGEPELRAEAGKGFRLGHLLIFAVGLVDHLAVADPAARAIIPGIEIGAGAVAFARRELHEIARGLIEHELVAAHDEAGEPKLGAKSVERGLWRGGRAEALPRLSYGGRRLGVLVLQLEDGAGLRRLDRLEGLGGFGRILERLFQTVGHDEGDGERNGDRLAGLDLSEGEGDLAGGDARIGPGRAQSRSGNLAAQQPIDRNGLVGNVLDEGYVEDHLPYVDQRNRCRPRIPSSVR